jgi:hypothetical protein
MKKLLTLSLLAIAAGAQAQLAYDTTGAYASPIGGNNVPSFSSGLVDALITTALPGTLTATFLGKEAGHKNLFEVWSSAGPVGISILNTAAVGTQGSTSVGSGALKFTFSDTNDGTTVSNGGNGNNNNIHGSYAIFGKRDAQGMWTPLTMVGNQKFDLVIGFNDGAKVDSDYDDHVFGLTMAPVPEPGTYALMAAGLAAVGFVARRRAPRA